MKCIMKQEWISVNDRLPEMYKRVLVFSEHHGHKTIYIMKRIPHDHAAPDNGKWHWSNVVNDNEITYWMPLPKMPKQP